jgi:hypothetical protein
VDGRFERGHDTGIEPRDGERRDALDRIVEIHGRWIRAIVGDGVERAGGPAPRARFPQLAAP